jgi:ABC-2 type transport system permease protein
MKKIPIIIRREYLSRVKKRSFIVMTILGPLLMAALMIVPIYLTQLSDETKTIAVVDETGIFFKSLTETENIKFVYLAQDIAIAKDSFTTSHNFAILYLPKEFVSKPSTAVLFSDKQAPISVKSYIETSLKKELEGMKLKASGIDKDVLDSIETSISINTFLLKGKGMEEKGSTEVSMALGLFAGIMIYMFIFMFGTQVLRGVIEEKTSRIVEVIVSSVKPFQLMMGKIIGIALVGLTQFILWIILTFVIVTFVQSALPDTFKNKKTEKSILRTSKVLTKEQAEVINKDNQSSSGAQEVFEALKGINYIAMIIWFLFYFMFGYLLYAALFAAVGSAVDSEADTQQFMLPITIPLIFAIVMSQFVINNPGGPVAFWLSIIPLTSPVIMMIRIPFGDVPFIDQVLSASILIISFLFCTWFAAKIYRTGILMYGKKSSYKELWKWLTYKS